MIIYFEEFDQTYFSKGVKKLQYRWNKCIKLKGDYVEHQGVTWYPNETIYDTTSRYYLAFETIVHPLARGFFWGYP